MHATFKDIKKYLDNCYTNAYTNILIFMQCSFFNVYFSYCLKQALLDDGIHYRDQVVIKFENSNYRIKSRFFYDYCSVFNFVTDILMQS